MRINHTISTSEILADLCAIRQNVQTKNAFVDIVYSVSAVKKFW